MSHYLAQPNMRYAKVVNAQSDRQLAAYLPDNYKQVGDENELYFDGERFIEGKDVSGWTLDGYVIPRLASGNIIATEQFVWCEDVGNGETGPSLSTWLEDEPQTWEAMERLGYSRR